MAETMKEGLERLEARRDALERFVESGGDGKARTSTELLEKAILALSLTLQIVQLKDEIRKNPL